LEPKGSGGQRARADRPCHRHSPAPQGRRTRIGKHHHTAILFLWILCFVTVTSLCCQAQLLVLAEHFISWVAAGYTGTTQRRRTDA
jgi:hypothetical protein